MSIRSCCLTLSSSAVLMLAAATASAAEEPLPAAAAAPVDYAATVDTTPSGAAMVADLVVARPLGLVATVLGTVVFVACLPFELISGNVSGPARRLVADPARFTFTRPLGQDVN